MFAALILFFLIEIPGEPPPYVKPQSATNVRYIELLENNTQIIYPALALLAMVAIVLGILQSLRSDEMPIELRTEVKREIIRELRKHLLGLSVEALSKAVLLPPKKVKIVLEEMKTENIIELRSDKKKPTWRMKISNG